MTHTMHYQTPLGDLLLSADEAGLTGAWFAGQKYYADKLTGTCTEAHTPILQQAAQWLDAYFAGRIPPALPPLHPLGTPFQLSVWRILLEIPRGQTMTYGQIAARCTEQTGKRAAAQAVGGAVGHNPISIFIPCHRVVGTNGSLTGYAGGLDKKIHLLRLEQVDMTRFYRPKTGTAL